jgi:quercetin dioxygenase-like cupin family protein
MELNGEWFEVKLGSVIQMDAGTRHWLVANEEVTTVLMAMPAFNRSDEHFD